MNKIILRIETEKFFQNEVEKKHPWASCYRVYDRITPRHLQQKSFKQFVKYFLHLVYPDVESEFLVHSIENNLISVVMEFPLTFLIRASVSSVLSK